MAHLDAPPFGQCVGWAAAAGVRLSVPTIRHSPIGSGPHISTCHFAPGFERAAILSFSRSFCGKPQSGRPALAVEEHGAAKGACSFSRWPPSRNHSVAIVAVFFARNYPSTIFSPWMLAQHFYGLLEHNELRSCRGVVVSNLKHGSANLGNFLSSPNHRRRGLAGAPARSFMIWRPRAFTLLFW